MLLMALLILVPVWRGLISEKLIPSNEDCHLIVNPVFPVKDITGFEELPQIVEDPEVIEIVPAIVAAST